MGMLVRTSEEIIASHLPSCRDRARIELDIVDRLIAAAAAKEYALEVCMYRDGAPYSDDPIYDVRTALFDLDEAWVYVLDGGQELGWVYLVFGNGADLISDYTFGLDEFVKPLFS